MHRPHSVRFPPQQGLVVALLALLTTSCVLPDIFAASASPAQANCPDVGKAKLVALVRDQSGRPAAIGATLRITDRSYEEVIGPGMIWDSLAIPSFPSRTGRYLVTVTKPGYDGDARIDVRSVGVPPCFWPTAPTIVPLTLTLRPDADPVRSVVVLPAAIGLGLPDITVQLHPYLDAAPGVDTLVTWHSSDTTVATVSPSGLLRSQCRHSQGTATIIATSVMDPSKRGEARVSVGRAPGPC